MPPPASSRASRWRWPRRSPATSSAASAVEFRYIDSPAHRRCARDVDDRAPCPSPDRNPRPVLGAVLTARARILVPPLNGTPALPAMAMAATTFFHLRAETSTAAACASPPIPRRRSSLGAPSAMLLVRNWSDCQFALQLHRQECPTTPSWRHRGRTRRRPSSAGDYFGTTPSASRNCRPGVAVNLCMGRVAPTAHGNALRLGWGVPARLPATLGPVPEGER